MSADEDKHATPPETDIHNAIPSRDTEPGMTDLC